MINVSKKLRLSVTNNAWFHRRTPDLRQSATYTTSSVETLFKKMKYLA